jgi:hypothetical protein
MSDRRLFSLHSSAAEKRIDPRAYVNVRHACGSKLTERDGQVPGNYLVSDSASSLAIPNSKNRYEAESLKLLLMSRILRLRHVVCSLCRDEESEGSVFLGVVLLGGVTNRGGARPLPCFPLHGSMAPPVTAVRALQMRGRGEIIGTSPVFSR